MIPKIPWYFQETLGLSGPKQLYQVTKLLLLLLRFLLSFSFLSPYNMAFFIFHFFANALSDLEICYIAKGNNAKLIIFFKKMKLVLNYFYDIWNHFSTSMRNVAFQHFSEHELYRHRHVLKSSELFICIDETSSVFVNKTKRSSQWKIEYLFCSPWKSFFQNFSSVAQLI